MHPEKAMSAGRNSGAAAAEAPQQLVGYRTNEEWHDLLAQTAALIGTLEEIEDDRVRAQVFDALAAVDTVHRESLHRLVRLFKDGVLEQVVSDPAINTLMGMYGLLPQKTPGCQKVWDFLGPQERAEDVAADPAAMPPHWTPAPGEAPAEGAVHLVRMEEGSFALARTAGRMFAFDAICHHHGKPMTGGEISDFAFICPHGPGCVYDVRNGARLGGGPGLECRPVRVDDRGRVLVGFGMPFTPDLPAF